MIPRAHIVEWGSRTGWPTGEQVEQDVLLSRLIIEIANDPYLGEESCSAAEPASTSCT